MLPIAITHNQEIHLLSLLNLDRYLSSCTILQDSVVALLRAVLLALLPTSRCFRLAFVAPCGTSLAAVSSCSLNGRLRAQKGRAGPRGGREHYPQKDNFFCQKGMMASKSWVTKPTDRSIAPFHSLALGKGNLVE